MEQENRHYRFKSVPDLVLNLESMGVAELILLDNSLLAQEERLTADIAQVQFELDFRMDVDGV